MTQPPEQVDEKLISLLRRLPEVDPPRSFALGPRLQAEPPTVVRLRRWYTATRMGAAALAAVFAFLFASVLYLDSRPLPTASGLARPQVDTAAGAAPQSAPTPIAPRSAAAPAAAVRPAQAPQPDDQVAAATSVNPLPTRVPTPRPTPLAVPSAGGIAAEAPSPSGTLSIAAAAIGFLAGLMLLCALMVRHRLQRVASQPWTESSP